MLCRYAVETVTARREQQTMADAYHAQADVSSGETPADTASVPAASTPETAPAEEASATVSDEGSDDTLPIVVYPQNPNATYDAALASVRNQNADIMAWLQVDELVDSAVVLRDNTYYLNHDISGRSSSHGAIFLDERTAFVMNRRPYTFIVYGHNMKSGTMFGRLKKYEGSDWYYAHPFITFNTLYEEGEYAVFSVAVLNVESSADPSYVDFDELYVSGRTERMACIDRIRSLSLHCNRIPLSGDDQLLLLITCDGDDAERLVVAARRIRSDESRESLQKLIP